MNFTFWTNTMTRIKDKTEITVWDDGDITIEFEVHDGTETIFFTSEEWSAIVSHVNRCKKAQKNVNNPLT